MKTIERIATALCLALSIFVMASAIVALWHPREHVPIRWKYNAPRPPWTDYEQEFTRHPSAAWGYGGLNAIYQLEPVP